MIDLYWVAQSRPPIGYIHPEVIGGLGTIQVNVGYNDTTKTIKSRNIIFIMN